MKKLFFAVLMFSFIFPQTGKVIQLQGQASVQKLGASPVPLKKGAAVNQGQYIITKPSSTVKIKLASGAILTVGPSSRMRIQPSTIKQASSSTSVSLFSGTLSASIKKLGKSSGKFNIHTPTAVAGVRGTDFTVAAGLDGSSYVAVDDGKVAVDNGKGETVCNKKETAETPIGEDEAPEKDELDDKEQLNEWLTENEEDVNDDPDEALEKMEQHLKGVADNAKELAENSERAADKDLNTDDKNYLHAKKKKALEMDQKLISSDTANEAIMDNAQSLLKQYKDDRKVKRYKEESALDRINKMITDYNSRINAALNRLNQKLAEAYKRIEDSYEDTGKRIDKSFDKADFDIDEKKMDMDQ